MVGMGLLAVEKVWRLSLAMQRGEIGVGFAEIAQADLLARRREYWEGRLGRGEWGPSPVRRPRFPNRFWAGQ